MSWQDLVDNNLVGTGNVAKAAICGLDGSIWAKSANFNLDGAEAATAAKAFSDPGAALANGLRFEGQKFFVLQADDERVIGKKAADGFFLYKTLTAFIIALYDANVRPEQCSKVSGDLADYFKKTNY
ncbi:unnamed protein product [Bursaphelenchus xylophilus]|uniref:Profilin n=1 Tax=Bursaphelenchus xylophilus TaxID=6326 RepID=A0A1I7SMP0_BURXY|nr:unnamed protein product [Bursaphelenchus xylophilus]CAG9130302.1 unnamed protein product [Bursaphelenchus xylophilus]